MSSPAVIFTNKFIYDWYVGVNDFYDYIGREEAFEPDEKKSQLENDNEEILENIIEHNYDYFSYMKNEKKSDGLFDNESDILSHDKIEHYRKLEKQSQKEGCPKYIWVVSFDNKFLEENGLLVRGHLDTERLKDVARQGANALINKSDKLKNNNVYWTGAIHVNTDNIHIHYSVCEYHRLEDRKKTYAGKGQDTLELSAMKKMKSVIANGIVGKSRTPALTAFKRENLIPNFSSSITASRDVLTLAKVLPPKPPHSAWKYGDKKIKPYQPLINECIDKIIRADEKLKRDYDAYVDMLDDVSKGYIDFYGEKSQAMVYAQNQLDDFYNRAGNQLLQAMYKMSQKEERSRHSAYLKKEEKEDYAEYKRFAADKEFLQAANVLKKHIKNPTFEFTLAKLYAENFIGIYQDQGFDMLRKIADDPSHYNSDKANLYLSRKYLKDNDIENAIKTLTPLAEKGNSFSQYSLGKLYLREQCRDTLKAAHWLKRSADNGNKYAQCAYGLMCVKSDSEQLKTIGYNYLGQAMLGGNQFAYNYLQSQKQDYKKYSGSFYRKPTVKSAPKTIHKLQAQKAVRNYHKSYNACWHIIKQMMSEYEQHIRQLKNEFEYENNIVTDEYDIGYDYSID